jgi:TolB-like protein/tetratricopeptide (TPR) repeat protein
VRLAVLISDVTAELRRRHVVRVAVAYCAAGWVVAQASATLLPALGVPYWSVSLVTVLVLLGLPVAIVLSWAFDLTPEGVVRTPRAPSAAGVAPAVLVMPFAARGAAGEDFLGSGVTEELIGALAQAGARVVSRTTAAALQASGTPPRALVEDFGITHIVEGSIGAADGRLRASVRLAAASDGFTMWSSTYERDPRDLFDVQRRIAQSVVAALRPALLPHGRAADGHGSRRAPGHDAYVHYLRGRQQWEQRTPELLRLALHSFASAVALDADFARAHAGIADCWAILVDYGSVRPADGLPHAQAAAEYALHIDPQLAEARSSAALVAQLEWRFAEAEAGLRAALESNPAYQSARQRLALLLAWLGRAAEARAEIQLALEADPLSPVILTSQAWIEYFAGRHDAAIDITRRVLRDHDAAHARVPLALALVQAGRADEAVRELTPHITPAPVTPPLLAALALALGATGRTDEARRLALRLLASDGTAHPTSLAQAWLGAGDVEGALETLEIAASERAPQLVYTLADPSFDALREKPRFREITQLLRASA